MFASVVTYSTYELVFYLGCYIQYIRVSILPRLFHTCYYFTSVVTYSTYVLLFYLGCYIRVSILPRLLHTC